MEFSADDYEEALRLGRKSRAIVTGGKDIPQTNNSAWTNTVPTSNEAAKAQREFGQSRPSPSVLEENLK